jgi:hypothetical protein
VIDFTLEQYETLKAAAASGTLHVAFADRSQTFHSLDDMFKLLAYMERSLSAAGISYYRLAATSKGL